MEAVVYVGGILVGSTKHLNIMFAHGLDFKAGELLSNMNETGAL